MTKSIMDTDGGGTMAKMGRPKTDDPADKRVNVRFKGEEYDLLLEYAQSHDMSITQVIKLAVEKLISTNNE